MALGLWESLCGKGVGLGIVMSCARMAREGSSVDNLEERVVEWRTKA